MAEKQQDLKHGAVETEGRNAVERPVMSNPFTSVSKEVSLGVTGNIERDYSQVLQRALQVAGRIFEGPSVKPETLWQGEGSILDRNITNGAAITLLTGELAGQAFDVEIPPSGRLASAAFFGVIPLDVVEEVFEAMDDGELAIYKGAVRQNSNLMEVLGEVKIKENLTEEVFEDTTLKGAAFAYRYMEKIGDMMLQPSTY